MEKGSLTNIFRHSFFVNEINTDRVKEEECRDRRENPAEILKSRFKEEIQRRKILLLEQYSVQDPDDDEEEISSIQHHSENEESAEPVVGSRPPARSSKGMQPTTGSERLDKSIKRHLEERLRSAISRGQKLVPEEDLLFIKKSSQDFLEVRKAEYVSHEKRIQRERKLLFTPSSRPVPGFLKLPESMRPLYLEDDGLYVGKRPPMSNTNENILENRILKMEEGKKWIGDDGRILALSDPVKESSTRPPLFHLEEDLDPALQTVYRKATRSTYENQCTDGTLDPEGDYQLDVDVSGLIFYHHPLFSREHVLGARLAQLYDQYLTRQHNNLTGHLSDKLNGLRSTLRNIFEIHDSQSLTQAMQQRISDYSLEVRNTRQLRDSEQEKDRTLLKNIIKVWKEIKALREFQKFNNTPYKLFLRKENVDQASDQQVYEEEISAEVVELEAESEEDYQRKLAEYKKELAEWKLSRRKQKDKKKKTKKKKKGQLQDDKEEDEDQELSESEGPEEEDSPKPEPPERPDFDSIEQQVREKAFRIRRKPGESILIPELHASGNITANDLCPRVEVARRQDVERHSIIIKILYNDKGVSRTDSRFLDTDFRVHFVPESSALTGSVPLEEFVFSNNHRVMFDHEGVGSDVPLSFEAVGSNRQTLLTSGKLFCCVSWGIGEDDVPLAPPVSQQPGIHSGLRCVDAVTSIWGRELDDMKKTVEWAKQSPLDPNDPNNASIMQLLKRARSEEVHAPECFRLEQLQEEFYFVTDEVLELKRLQRLRRQVPYKMVQIHACSLKELPLIQWKWLSKLSQIFQK